MFGFFQTPSFSDSELGELRRKGGLWRGFISMRGDRIPLALSGSRGAPDLQALEIARGLSRTYPDWQPQIAHAMLEHYEPYEEAVSAGEADPPEDGMPQMAAPGDVWAHASIEFVQITPLDGELTVEIGYRVAWDDEHTLGARLRQGRLLELNGSVLAP
jgi:hypothetical protein